MLPKQHRLPGKTRFLRARVYKSPLFLLRVQPNTMEFSRFGFVVSKKVDKRAVVRNRLKRVFRSCIEDMLTQIHPKFDILFVLSQATQQVSKDAMKEEIQLVLQKARLV